MSKPQVYGISQVNIRYLAEEDRLLFSLNTTDKQQYRMYFTRGFVKLFWPHLKKILDAEPSAVSFDNKSQGAAKAFQHETALADADYESPFDMEGYSLPWGDDILVAIEVRYRDVPNELPVIGVYSKSGIGLEFNCGHKILHYLYQVLPYATDRAAWDLTLDKDTSMQFAVAASGSIN